VDKSVAQRSLEFCDLYEAELLTELMLRYWGHPLADDDEYRNGLLESSVEILRVSTEGQQLTEDIPAHVMNFTAAVWYAESTAISSEMDDSSETAEKRRVWLEVVRRAIPASFCDPDDVV